MERNEMITKCENSRGQHKYNSEMVYLPRRFPRKAWIGLLKEITAPSTSKVGTWLKGNSVKLNELCTTNDHVIVTQAYS